MPFSTSGTTSSLGLVAGFVRLEKLHGVGDPARHEKEPACVAHIKKLMIKSLENEKRTLVLYGFVTISYTSSCPCVVGAVPCCTRRHGAALRQGVFVFARMEEWFCEERAA